MYVTQSAHLKKCLPKNFKVPTEQDVSKAVDEVLIEIMGQAPKNHVKPITITKTGKIRKPHMGKETPNTFRSDFKDIHQYSNMLPHVEDIFMGAIRQNTTGNHLNRYMLFNLLKSLDTISAEVIYIVVNSHRPVAEHISERYAQQLANACRNVISAFEHHLEVKNITNYVVEDAIDGDHLSAESDELGYIAHTQPVQTPEHKRQLLVQAGLTDSQIKQCMTGCKVQWGKSISAKGGSTVTVESAHVHIDILPDNYDNLKWLSDLSCYVDVATGEIFTCS